MLGLYKIKGGKGGTLKGGFFILRAPLWTSERCRICCDRGVKERKARGGRMVVKRDNL